MGVNEGPPYSEFGNFNSDPCGCLANSVKTFKILWIIFFCLIIAASSEVMVPPGLLEITTSCWLLPMIELCELSRSPPDPIPACSATTSPLKRGEAQVLPQALQINSLFSLFAFSPLLLKDHQRSFSVTSLRFLLVRAICFYLFSTAFF